MTTAESTLINGLNMASTNLVNVEELSDEALTALLSLTYVLGQWLEAADAEAVSRARDGVYYPGYRLKDSSRRKIFDPDGATEAIREADPDLLPLCQRTELLGIKELTRRLGRDRFKNILSPFIESVHSYRLVPDQEGE